MKASKEARQEVRKAMRRLALSKSQASRCRAPKRRWIGQQRVEEAELDLEKAEDFSRTVDVAVALLECVGTELASIEDARTVSRPIVRSRKERRGASESMEGKTTATRSKMELASDNCARADSRPIVRSLDKRRRASDNTDEWRLRAKWHLTALRMERLIGKELLGIT